MSIEDARHWAEEIKQSGARRSKLADDNARLVAENQRLQDNFNDMDKALESSESENERLRYENQRLRDEVRRLKILILSDDHNTVVEEANARLREENQWLMEVAAIALEDLENSFPDDAKLSDVDTRESIRILRQALQPKEASE